MRDWSSGSAGEHLLCARPTWGRSLIPQIIPKLTRRSQGLWLIQGALSSPPPPAQDLPAQALLVSPCSHPLPLHFCPGVRTQHPVVPTLCLAPHRIWDTLQLPKGERNKHSLWTHSDAHKYTKTHSQRAHPHSYTHRHSKYTQIYPHNTHIMH